MSGGVWATLAAGRESVPGSPAWIGRYWPFGHHAHANRARRLAATRAASDLVTGRPEVARHTRRLVRRTTRETRYAMPTTGRARASIDTRITALSVSCPLAQLRARRSIRIPTLSHIVAATLGNTVTIKPRVRSSTGITVRTHSVTTARAHGRRTPGSLLPHRVGSRWRRVGLMCANRSGTPVRSARM